MKKRSLVAVLLALVLATSMLLSACNGAAQFEMSPNEGTANGDTQLLSLNTGSDSEAAYDIAVQNGFAGTYDAWVATVQDTSTPVADYVSITPYVSGISVGADMSDAIQNAIDQNPNRVIYFPDGVYTIAKPVLTPAVAEKSVSLKLSNYAIIRAMSTWTAANVSSTGDDTSIQEAMIRLGGKNNTGYGLSKLGSEYYFEGGIIDGNKKANCISIDSARHTRIEYTSLRNAKQVALHIKQGVNNKSSDADISNVNIYGPWDINTIGVLARGLDNTFTNMRIDCVFVGMKITGGGNLLENVHVLQAVNTYAGSIGFLEDGSSNSSGKVFNIYDRCYSDNFQTGFQLSEANSILNSPYVMWYATSSLQRAFYFTGKCNAVISTPYVNFYYANSAANNVFFTAQTAGGSGQIISPVFDSDFCTHASNNYGAEPGTDGPTGYLQTKIVELAY